ncbi:MAG TPA: hypothetical protein VFU49_06795, partial [Ktedonobacteraceae bacterium]|nr:hypothetical protein [Ktedonobacteraceae bacterium]
LMSEQQQAPQMLETGIKVVDLLTPIRRGGVIGLFGATGVGELVLVEELMHIVITHHHGYIVCLGMDENSYELSELMDPIKELGMQNRLAMVFEPLSSSQETCLRLVRAGLTIASEIRARGHEVLMVADYNVSSHSNLMTLDELKRVAQEQQITTLLLRSNEEDTQNDQSGVHNQLDGQIVFSRDLARQNLWPAIDRLLSSSRLLESSAVSSEHAQVAHHVRTLLQRAQKLQGQSPLSSEDQQAVKRAANIQQFFTQPFFIAEPYTEIPAEYVKIADTIKDFKELLEGRYDDLPEQAFHFTGTIEQVLARHKHAHR